MTRRPPLILLLLFTGMSLFTPLQIRAIEPSTFLTALPQAAQLAQTWSPQIFRAMGSTGTGLLKIGTAVFDIFRLPWGLLQSTLGAPFGFFDSGVQNMGKGLLAPCELVLQLLLLPVRIISLGTIY